MIYHAKKETIDTMTKYEKKEIQRLRKISILKGIPFNKWTSFELENLIYEYEIYFQFSRIKDKPVSINEFLYNGLYEYNSMFEELKSSELNQQTIKSQKLKSIKLKKIDS